MRRLRDLAALAPLAAVVAAAGCGGSGSLPLPQMQAAVVTPPPGAVVDARQWGGRDLALGRVGETATVSVVGPQGNGVNGLTVRIDGRTADSCGAGCYRARAGDGPVVVDVGGRSFRFDVPASAPPGAALVTRITRAYGRLRSVALVQRLASSAAPPLVTRFLFVAPDRLSYANEGGSQAVVIGARRWDRPSPTGRWARSPQQRVRVMHPPWRRAIDAHVVAPHTVTFFDPETRAWFRVVVDPQTSLPRTVRMIGVSHFMLDRFSRFDEPISIVPPR